MNSFIYLILREYFKLNNIPKELVNVILMFLSRNIKIVCGSNQVFIVKDKIYALGNSVFIATTPDYQFKKVVCGSYHNLAITYNKQIYSWGKNEFGELGLGNKISYDKPQRIGMSEINKIWCGYNFSIVLNTKGEIYGWGSNYYKQLIDKDCVDIKS